MSSNNTSGDEHETDGSGAAAALSDLSFWSAAEKTAEAELERRVESLQQELKKATEQLERIRSTSSSGGVRPVVAVTTKSSTTTDPSPIGTSTHRRPSPKALSVDDNGVPLRPPEKRGYLFKWMVRSRALSFFSTSAGI
jgi:hypothetical protein